MRYWFDFEFIEDSRIIDPISLGIVAEDGRELYIGNKDCNFYKADSWVAKNVLVPLHFTYENNRLLMPMYLDPQFWKYKDKFIDLVAKFLGCEEDPENPKPWSTEPSYRLKKNIDPPKLIGYYSATDFVAFYQLFGRLVDRPTGFPCHHIDLQQIIEIKGLDEEKILKEIPRKGCHNALEDARWNKKLHDLFVDNNLLA